MGHNMGINQQSYFLDDYYYDNNLIMSGNISNHTFSI